MNTKFLEEAKLLEANWDKLGLLAGLERLPQIEAVILQGHRLCNEGQCWCGLVHGHSDTPDA